MENRPKAIALMSGGLDSTLAAKIVKDQGVEVVGLHLVSPFGCRTEVQKSADAVGIPLLFRDKGESYLELVENPRYGYGRNMNPCIDCRIFMFQLADVVRQDEKADFVVTGEVLGQRPMSQQRHAMELIERMSPLEGLVLRPLSAHCLATTIPEENGWVRREDFYQIAGRGRTPQLELAEKFGITDFAAPGGGCLLTEAAFSNRLRDFFKRPLFSNDNEKLAQSALLRLGRHFRLGEKAKLIVGRNEGENHEIEKLAFRAKGTLYEPHNFDGPTALILGEHDQALREFAGQVIARYGKSQGLSAMEIRSRRESEESLFTVSNRALDARLEEIRI